MARRTRRVKSQPKQRLLDIKPHEVSLVDQPAIGETFMVVKGMVAKANEPKDGMSNDELEAAREARSKAFGIEVLEKGSHLTYPANYPTKLAEYGDPVNLKYPTDTIERSRNARTRFKQNHDAYSKNSSKKVVHTRIVKAELKHGVVPSYDPEDPLDKMLPSDVVSQIQTAQEKETKKMGDKLDTKAVPRPVMKAIENRLNLALGGVREITEVVKGLDVSDSAEERAVPAPLVHMTKSIRNQIQSLLPRSEVSVAKRAAAEASLPISEIQKRWEAVAKVDAVSYLMRDQWMTVMSGVEENLTTYVDRIDHDDDGPMLLPMGLEETVDKSTEELDELVKDADPSLVDSGAMTLAEGVTESAEVAKLSRENKELKTQLTELQKVNARLEERVKVFSTSELASATVADDSIEEGNMDNETTTDDVAVDDTNADEATQETGGEPESEAAPESSTESEAETEGGDDTQPDTKAPEPTAVEKLLAEMKKSMEDGFASVKEDIIKLNERQDATESDIKKMSRVRGDSKGEDVDETVTQKKADDPASFVPILGPVATGRG